MLQCPTLLSKIGKATVLVLLCTTLPAVSLVMVLMVLMCQDYTCYLFFKNLPVLIATVPVYLITILLMILDSRSARNTTLGKWYLDKTSAVTQLAFASFLKQNRNPNNEEEEEEEEEKKVFTIFGYEASLKEMCWLFIILVQATLLAFAQFWDEFLLEESYLCSTHPTVRCFSTTYLSPYGQTINCSDIDTSDTSIQMIICYKYVFNAGHAAASAIGIISATGLIIYIVCLVFLKVLNGIRLHKRLITGIKVLIAVEIIMFCELLYFLPLLDTVRGGSSAVNKPDNYASLRSSYKTLTIGIIIISSIFSFPWNKFRKSEYEEL